MKKSLKFLSVLFSSCVAFSMYANAADVVAQEGEKSTTRNDAVIFKVHDISPVLEDGVVTGCDFSLTLYNRTAVNFRSFTINMEWNDAVEERFKFERYVSSILSENELDKQKEYFGQSVSDKPLKTSVAVNAFGADKQVSIRAHVDNEKCYLMLQEASYTVSPCEIARGTDVSAPHSLDKKECTPMFQMVDTSNPEYYGQFKNISATDLAAQDRITQTNDLADIDEVIAKIVENLGTSDQVLTDIN